MSDHKLESLLHMAREIEGWERDLQSSDAASALRFPSNGGSKGWRAVGVCVSFAAAAALACLFIVPSRLVESSPAIAQGPVPSLDVCRLPAEATVQRLTVDRTEPTTTEPAYLLALTRTWNRDCDCLLWDLQRWADGAMLASSRGSDTLELNVATGPANALQQVLVLAVAQERTALARSASDGGVELLNCLNSRDLPASGEHDGVTYSSALESCLPSGVTIVSHSLASR